jgi:tellurite resistance protein TerC
MESVAGPVLWAGFMGFVAVMLALDLGVFHRRTHTVRLREAALWSAAWIGLALLFNGGIALRFGPEKGLEFLTGYLIEKALSVDNLFVFVVIFAFFKVPGALQHKVLFWGIIGALGLRAVFIFAGGALLEALHWMIYVFGAVLLLTGGRLLFRGGEEPHPERNPVVRLFSRFVPIAPGYSGSRFTVLQAGKRAATPLLLALVTVEATDVVFAVDSIPAVFAVTRDPFIVFTSNIFAILGLRSLYFLLAGVIGRFRFLKIGLAAILIFVGAKMLVSGVLEVPIGLSLGVVGGMLAVSVAASLVFPKRGKTPLPAPRAEASFTGERRARTP